MGRPKGLPKTGGRKCGSKNKLTLKKEELRQIFHNKMVDEWDNLLEQQIIDAANNFKARHYIFDQIIDKPMERTQILGDENNPIQIEVGIQETINKIYGQPKSN